MLRVVAIAQKRPVVDEGGESSRKNQGDTDTGVKVVAIRRIIVEAELVPLEIVHHAKANVALVVLELVDIFERALRNEDAEPGLDGERCEQTDGGGERRLLLAVVGQLEPSRGTVATDAIETGSRPSAALGESVDGGEPVVHACAGTHGQVPDDEVVAGVQTHRVLVA